MQSPLAAVRRARISAAASSSDDDYEADTAHCRESAFWSYREPRVGSATAERASACPNSLAAV